MTLSSAECKLRLKRLLLVLAQQAKLPLLLTPLASIHAGEAALQLFHFGFFKRP